MNIIITDLAKQESMIPDTHMLDKRLSWKAKAVLTMLIVAAGHYEVSQCKLADLSSDGEAVVRSALRELTRHGYLIRERTRSEDGKMGEVLYKICLCPPGATANDYTALLCNYANAPKSRI